ncbi:hypothetical protein GQ44DRAFT_723721 [Phaeosphaeriaceae sp. PMI808]|nr:hypothetical protein GQ44DRAFT_723721 [Phaeosphaeriaceae sp. PMI808]
MGYVGTISIFVREERPSASMQDLEPLKHFVLLFAKSIDGTHRRNACVETVRNYWNTITGAWRRKYKTISSDLIESITNIGNYIYDELMQELELLREKTPQRYADRNHLMAHTVQLWRRDWYEYKRSGTRVTDWGLQVSNIFTSSRDAENMARVPDTDIHMQRPKNSLAEGREPGLLCFNPILPFLANLLNISAFRDYSTIEELLDIVPLEHTQSQIIAWREDLMDSLFFLSLSKVGHIKNRAFAL